MTNVTVYLADGRTYRFNDIVPDEASGLIVSLTEQRTNDGGFTRVNMDDGMVIINRAQIVSVERRDG